MLESERTQCRDGSITGVAHVDFFVVSVVFFLTSRPSSLSEHCAVSSSLSAGCSESHWCLNGKNKCCLGYSKSSNSK